MTLPQNKKLVHFALLLGLSVLPATASAAQLALAWTDTAVDEDGFLVERRNASGGGFAQIVSLGPNAVAYLDSGVAAGNTYCYRVLAFNAVGMSAYTNEVCGTAAAGAPGPAPATSPLSVALAKSSFSRAETLVVTVNAVAGAITTPVDAYVVVQGSGGLLSLQLDGRLVPGLVPLVSGIVLPTVSAPFGLPLAGAPPGAYTWLAAATSPGTLTLVSPIVSTPFTIVP